MTHLVQLTDVTKIYNGAAPQPALNGVSLEIDGGEFSAIMGPSGSGKSTLLNLVAGLDRPTAGSVVVDGLRLDTLRESELARYRRDHIGFVFQFFHLLNNLTVRENVLIPAQLSGVKPRAAQERAAELLAQLGIGDKAEEYPARLSGGQRQRVAVARALINRPALLLADEPTGALDSRSGEGVMELLEELNQTGQTIILVTHDAKLATRHAGRVITLYDGRIDDDTRLESSAGRQPRELIRLEARGVTR
jgi:putative ABC transport system ATP-binding protein